MKTVGGLTPTSLVFSLAMEAALLSPCLSCWHQESAGQLTLVLYLAMLQHSCSMSNGTCWQLAEAGMHARSFGEQDQLFKHHLLVAQQTHLM
jgi:hypothetical protein